MRTPPPAAFQSLRFGAEKPGSMSSALACVSDPNLVSVIIITSGFMYSTRLANSAFLPVMLLAFTVRVHQFFDFAGRGSDAELLLEVGLGVCLWGDGLPALWFEHVVRIGAGLL